VTDGTPEVYPLAGDGKDHFIQVPPTTPTFVVSAAHASPQGHDNQPNFEFFHINSPAFQSLTSRMIAVPPPPIR
jgi:hypothetical protein